MSQSRGAESAHRDIPPPCGQKGKLKREAGALAQSAKCATVPIWHLCQVGALITSACLKHSDVTKLDNCIEMSPTAVHMKPFSMIERVRHLGSTDSCPTADAKGV